MSIQRQKCTKTKENDKNGKLPTLQRENKISSSQELYGHANENFSLGLNSALKKTSNAFYRRRKWKKRRRQKIAILSVHRLEMSAKTTFLYSYFVRSILFSSEFGLTKRGRRGKEKHSIVSDA